VWLAHLFNRRPRDDAGILRARFARFRHLLEMNNRVLRLMADANEKLGGEYLFDTQYLHAVASELGESVTAGVRDLAEMSGNRYPALSVALERVQTAIGSCIEPHRIAANVPLAIPIDEIGTELADVVGEKMARLGEIRCRLALAVPDGFVVTARASERLLSDATVANELESHRQGRDGASARLRTAIMSANVPSDVSGAIKEALGRFPRHARFAVRSSALGEDGELSFAGQHSTVLNVPRERVLGAWLQVVASLFSARALEYRQHHGLPSSGGDMAVGCLMMVPATASGVVYTVDPGAPQSGALVVSATRGLGVSVVEGTGAVDRFTLSRAVPHRVLACDVADKREIHVAAPDHGTAVMAVPEEQRRLPACDDDTLARLADTALRIERHMRCPQDIEWALGSDGGLVVLQARPLHIGPESRPQAEVVLSARERHHILMQGRGDIACRGVGMGPVFVVGPDEGTDGFVPGSVVVTRLASPRLSPLVAAASAIVSDVGSVTGHLATVAREYRVPMMVGTQDATRLLTTGTVVTVDADEATIYEGSVEELLRYELLRSKPYEETPEFRALRRILRHVSPLHLRDPGARNFTPEQCRTYHDIIRFAHERALVELGRLDGIRLDGRHSKARMLDLDVPLDLFVIDLGGGIAPGSGATTLAWSQVTSRPLAIVVEGLLTPGAWSTNPAEMDLEGFMASATRAGPLTVPGSGAVRRNVAIVSADYLNLNLRVGYHFNIVDCYLSDNEEDGYIFFRFIGGVTDVVRRTRRARLLAAILGQQGFKTEQSGELVIGRLQGVPRALCEERLRMIGRLIGFSRQLDIFLRDDRTVDRLASAFLQGRYQVTLDVLTKEQGNADRH
jgi:pyruvate,water dikinase